MKRFLLVALLVVPGVLAATGEASARTTIRVEGNVVIIHVPIYVERLIDAETGLLRNPRTGEQMVPQAVADMWEADIEKKWNDGFAGLRYRDCLTFRLEVEIVAGVSEFLEPIPEGFHHLFFGDPETVPTIWDPTTMNPNDDTTSAYDQSLEGQIGWGWPYNHEIGHLLGLGDDYDHETGETVNGRGDSFMGGSGTGVSQRLVDRIGDLIDEAEDLPECWTGTMLSETERHYVSTVATITCTDAWSSELRFGVDKNGVVKGDGRAVLLLGPECLYSQNPAQQVFFTIVGESNEEGFSLRLGYDRYVPADGAHWAGFPANIITYAGENPQPPGRPFEVPKTGPCDAEAEVTAREVFAVADGPDTMLSHNTIELTCSDES